MHCRQTGRNIIRVESFQDPKTDSVQNQLTKLLVKVSNRRIPMEDDVTVPSTNVFQIVLGRRKGIVKPKGNAKSIC